MAIMIKDLKHNEWPIGDAKAYAHGEWCFHLDGTIRGCTLSELARRMLDALQTFMRCDSLEVWINIVFRDHDLNEMMSLLKDTKLVLACVTALNL
jgi:hypothetical protein